MIPVGNGHVRVRGKGAKLRFCVRSAAHRFIGWYGNALSNFERLTNIRHWFPKLVYGLNQKPQTDLITKFGGLPWGLPKPLWPICAECGRPMHFLAQLEHSPPFFDFGERQVLHAFICNFDSICSFWDTDSGANSVFLVDRSDMANCLTRYPVELVESEEIDGQFTTFLELRLTGWETFEDQLTLDQKPLFYDHDAFWKLDNDTAFPADFSLMKHNKAGPIPYWTGNGPSPRLEKTEIFFQVTGDTMPVQDHPPSIPAMLSAEGTSWIWDGKRMTPQFGQTDIDGISFVNWANFCSDGTGFFFREETSTGLRYGLEILR